MMTPSVSVPASVILATSGSSDRLAEVLRRAREQADALGGELLLVWNANPADERRPLAPGIAALAHRTIVVPDPGKSRALNAGVREARGRICAFLDDDGLPEDGWLAALLEPFVAAEVGGVGGRVRPVHEDAPPAWYERLSRGRKSYFLGPLHDLGGEPLDYARTSLGVLPLGANCAYRRELLLRLGYATNLGPNSKTGCRGGEDTLLARQVLDLGHRLVYASRAAVMHPVRHERMTPAHVTQAYYWQGVEKVRIRRALAFHERNFWRPQVRLRILKYGLLRPLRPLVPASVRLSWDCRETRHRGVLDELMGKLPMMAIVLAVALLVASCGHERPHGDPARPNVVLCVIDTLRADHLGCYGYPRATSPNLDRFAADSVRFERAFAQAPRTVASHASMFTSTYPAVHGAWNQAGPLDSGQELPSLGPDAVCLAEVLQAIGYRTAAVADGGWLQVDRGLAQGFETFHSRFRGAKDRVDFALEWLDSDDAESPFFLFLHTYEVHTPYVPDEELLADLAPDYTGPLRERLRQARELLAGGDVKNAIVDVHRQLFEPLLPTLSDADVEFLMALYDAEIRSADREIGRFLDELAARGLLEHTIVIVTSDHGEEFREHGAFEHTQVYDECLHVPLIIRLPDGPRGVAPTEPVELVDLMPTLLRELGVRVPPSAQGRALDLRQAAQAADDRELWAESNEPRPQVAWRRGSLKAVLFPDGSEPARLYDLARDPEERAAILSPAVSAELLDEVTDRFGAFRAQSSEHRAKFRLQPVERGRQRFHDDQLEELRALGYL
jgi:arylsulfatase A-like enzyme/glycosyltransferase involved in cell wall biosynthesis